VTSMGAEGSQGRGTSTQAMPGWQPLLLCWQRPPASPCPPHPRESTEPAGNRPSLPLLTAALLCCLHQTQRDFKSISIFNENFSVYAFLASVCWYFARHRCLVFPGIGIASVLPLALTEQAGTEAPRQDPGGVPGSTAPRLPC